MTKTDILRRLSANRQALDAFGVQRLALFGSYARDQPEPNSDIDLLVEFAPGGKTFDNFMGLAFYLQDLFGKHVELVTRESLSPYIGPHILREAVYADLAA